MREKGQEGTQRWRDMDEGREDRRIGIYAEKEESN